MGESSKQSPGKLTREIGGVFPTHGPFCHPTPVAKDTFSSIVKFATNCCACCIASAQLSLPSPALNLIKNKLKLCNKRFVERTTTYQI